MKGNDEKGGKAVATIEPRGHADVDLVNEEIHETYTQIARLISAGVPHVVDLHGDNKEVMIQTLALHQRLIKGMQMAEQLLTTKIIDNNLVKYGGEAVEGVGFVEIHRTGDKKRIDNPMIASLVQKRLTLACAVDEETGEINDQASKAVAKAVETMVRLTGSNTESFNGWRKKVAQSLAIDINKYETREGGRLVVTIT